KIDGRSSCCLSPGRLRECGVVIHVSKLRDIARVSICNRRPVGNMHVQLRSGIREAGFVLDKLRRLFRAESKFVDQAQKVFVKGSAGKRRTVERDGRMPGSYLIDGEPFGI